MLTLVALTAGCSMTPAGPDASFPVSPGDPSLVGGVIPIRGGPSEVEVVILASQGASVSLAAVLADGTRLPPAALPAGFSAGVPAIVAVSSEGGGGITGIAVGGSGYQVTDVVAGSGLFR